MNKRFELMMKKEQRKLVVVDIENVVGTGMLTKETVARHMRHIASKCHLSDKDILVIGVSHSKNAFVVALQVPNARIVLRNGKDGADLALKTVLRKERVEERFQEVVIVSGDHAFAEEAQALENKGTHVTIVARRRTLSRKLAHSASRLLRLRYRRENMSQEKAA